MNRGRTLAAAWMVAAILTAGPARAQSPPQFEVASIRPTAPGVDSSTSDLLPGGRFHATNRTVLWLARVAWSVPDEQILGGPAWIRTDGYDIDGKIDSPQPMTPEQLAPLLRSLLAERFGLQVHREARQVSGYSLAVEKSGPKLQQHTGSSETAMSNSLAAGKMTLTAAKISMATLAGFLGRQLARPVVDGTGIAGEFDLTLDWAPDERVDSSAPSLFTALREQLGLKLESQRVPVEMVVIDSVARPSEN
jgi:uncharacterized protein (TIGR03435 family)